MGYRWCLAVMLGLVAVIAVSAPAGAVDVTDCGNFTTSNPDGGRFDLKNSIVATAAGTCLIFPQNSVVFMNGFLLVGPGLDSGATGISLRSNSFI